MSKQGTSDRLRGFIAISVPEEIKERIASAQTKLATTVKTSSVRWTTPEQFHLTLRFLGNIAAVQVDPLIASVRASCGLFQPFNLRAETIGAFPRFSSPRVIWVGVSEKENRLPELHRAIQTATNPFTREEPEERFSAHITLARVRELQASERAKLVKEGEAMSKIVFGEWTAHEVHLMRSQLSSKGARYSIVASVPLGPG